MNPSAGAAGIRAYDLACWADTGGACGKRIRNIEFCGSSAVKNKPVARRTRVTKVACDIAPGID